MSKKVEQVIAESDSIFGDIMKGNLTFDTKSNKVLRQRGRTTKQSRSDSYLKLCDKCNSVWEKEFNTWRITGRSNNPVKYICKYEEIPRYKKPVETCPVCLGTPNVIERKIY
jgi:hypothetical protein